MRASGLGSRKAGCATNRRRPTEVFFDESEVSSQESVAIAELLLPGDGELRKVFAS